MLARIWMLSLALCLPLQAGLDVFYSTIQHFKIRSDGGGHQLSAQVSVEQKFISARSTEDTTFKIVEYPHTAITNIQAEFRGQRLDSRKISFHYPQSRNVFIDSVRIHEISFPRNLQPQEMVSYRYDESFESLAFFPMVKVPALNLLSRFEVIVDHPADLQVDFQVLYPREDLKPILENPSATRTSIRFENLADLPSLVSDPFEGIHASILTKITRGGVPLTPHTPAAFTRWYLDLLAPTSVPSEPMKALLADKLKQAGTRREKARVLFDYVKSEIRYIADEGSGHAFLPHSCSEVLEKKWGDCKDKARLLMVLGRMHGIPIHMVLLSTRPRPDFSEVNVGLFNHVICVLDDGGELLFMDPTAPSSELGDPPGGNQRAKALVMNPDNPRYVDVLSNATTPELDLTITCDAKDLQKGKANVILRHSWRAFAAQARKEMNDREFERYLRGKLEKLLPTIPVERFRVVREDREALVMEADSDLSEFIVVSDESLYASSAPFRAFSSEILERERDSYTLDASGPTRCWLTLKLMGPGLGTKPERIVLGGEQGPSHTAVSSGSKGNVDLGYQFVQPYRLVPKEGRAAFLEFCSRYIQASGRLFTIQRSAP